jgi:hypothetical protein
MVWKVVRENPASEAATPTAAPDAEQAPSEAARTQNERKDSRIGAKSLAVIRHPHLGDETVTTENVSSGGLCVRSIRRYRPETLVEVAFPYTHGGAKVFVGARIEHVTEVPGEKFRLYGLAYIPAQEGWPQK